MVILPSASPSLPLLPGPPPLLPRRGGHPHLQISRMLDSDQIPDLRSVGVKDHTFLKNRRQRLCPLLRLLSIVIDPAVEGCFHTFNVKNIVPSTQRSKVVSINIPILTFL
jgi:hypothetical protein